MKGSRENANANLRTRDDDNTENINISYPVLLFIIGALRLTNYSAMCPTLHRTLVTWKTNMTVNAKLKVQNSQDLLGWALAGG